jgi:hypothetical protein
MKISACLLRFTRINILKFFLFGGKLLSNITEEDTLKQKIQEMEKEIPYLIGKKKSEAKKEYFKLLKSCGKKFRLNEPIYLKRK